MICHRNNSYTEITEEAQRTQSVSNWAMHSVEIYLAFLCGLCASSVISVNRFSDYLTGDDGGVQLVTGAQERNGEITADGRILLVSGDDL